MQNDRSGPPRAPNRPHQAPTLADIELIGGRLVRSISELGAILAAAGLGPLFVDEMMSECRRVAEGAEPTRLDALYRDLVEATRPARGEAR